MTFLEIIDAKHPCGERITQSMSTYLCSFVGQSCLQLLMPVPEGRFAELNSSSLFLFSLIAKSVIKKDKNVRNLSELPDRGWKLRRCGAHF